MDLRAIFMGVVFAFMWASAFTSARILVLDAPPLTALVLRFLLAGALAVGIARYMGQSWRLSRSQWVLTVVFGICQNGLYLGMNFVAMQTVEASLAAIVASTMPLWVAFVGWTVLGQKVPALGIAGLVAGFAGTALIMGSRISGGVDLVGLAMCVIGVLALTAATLAVRGASSGGNVLMIVGLQMWIGALTLSGFALTLESWDVNWTWRLAGAFLYVLFIPGLAATWVWFRLVNRIGAVRAATFHFLTPFFGVAIAAAVLGEALGPLDVLGVAVIAGGILAVQLSKQKHA